MAPYVTLALAQFQPRKGDYAGNLARVGALLAQAWALEPRPRLVCFPDTTHRPVDPRYALTYGQELITVSMGLTKGGRDRFYFPSRAEGVAMFERAGFVVDVVEMPKRIYTDVLYLARKAPTKP